MILSELTTEELWRSVFATEQAAGPESVEAKMLRREVARRGLCDASGQQTPKNQRDVLKSIMTSNHDGFAPVIQVGGDSYDGKLLAGGSVEYEIPEPVGTLLVDGDWIHPLGRERAGRELSAEVAGIIAGATP